jgi:phosphatidylserine/phosphatidylglycerophosphate/cardiolipin synthase-like enzyme
MLTVDGKVALVGGHNMWTEDYLLDQPIHDLSMEIRGGAAVDAHHFADTLWQFVCDHTSGDTAVSAFIYRSGSPDVGQGCLAGIKLPARGRAGTSGIPVLAVGRLGAGVTDDFASQNDLARDLLFGGARHSIRIVQQDVAFTLGRFDAIYPESTLERWLDFLLAGRGDIYLVLSNLDAKGRSKSEYSNGVPLKAVARKMLEMARARSQLSPAFLADLLCTHFHLASFRFGPDATWPGGDPIGNHGKFWMVDDRYFYIGSDNLYPVDLQEFGYIVDSHDAAAELLQSYWDPLWRWSRVTAVSGSGAARCVLRDQQLSY